MQSTNITLFISKLIATWGFLGFVPKAPGTAGSLGGLLVWYILTLYFDSLGLSIAFLVTSILGLYATGCILRHSTEKDPQIIVIDEVIGIWIAAFTLTPQSSIFAWIGAFILFRFFDIKKPWLISKAEQLPGEVGIIADDVVAGIFSLVLIVAFQIILSLG